MPAARAAPGRGPFAPVGLGPAGDIEDVAPGGGEVDVVEKLPGRRGRPRPAAGVRGSGVVFGQGVGDRIVAVGPSPQGAGEIPRARVDVVAHVPQHPRPERFAPCGLRPVFSGHGGHLHQADLPGVAVREGIEPAFAPDHGLDERRRDAVPFGGLEDQGIVGVFPGAGAVDPPGEKQGVDQEDRQDDLEGRARGDLHGRSIPRSGDPGRLKNGTRLSILLAVLDAEPVAASCPAMAVPGSRHPRRRKTCGTARPRRVAMDRPPTLSSRFPSASGK